MHSRSYSTWLGPKGLSSALFALVIGGFLAAPSKSEAREEDNPTARGWIDTLDRLGVYYIYADAWIPYRWIAAPPLCGYSWFKGDTRVGPRPGGSSRMYQILVMGLQMVGDYTYCTTWFHFYGVGQTVGLNDAGTFVRGTASLRGFSFSIFRFLVGNVGECLSSWSTVSTTTARSRALKQRMCSLASGEYSIRNAKPV